jgi:hypothetical protein
MWKSMGLLKGRYKGMSLVEALVAIAIFGIAMEGFALLFVKSWQNNAFIFEEGVTIAAVSRGVSSVVDDLRKVRQSDAGDYPIKSGSDFDLVVFLDIDNDEAVEKVHYFLDGTDLKRGISDPITGTPTTYPAGDDEVVVIAERIVNAASDPVFSYYNKDYPGDTANNPLDTPVAIQDVRLIKVHLLMNIDPNKAPDNINIESFAELRNLNDY